MRTAAYSLLRRRRIASCSARRLPSVKAGIRLVTTRLLGRAPSGWQPGPVLGWSPCGHQGCQRMVNGQLTDSTRGRRPVDHPNDHVGPRFGSAERVTDLPPSTFAFVLRRSTTFLPPTLDACPHGRARYDPADAGRAAGRVIATAPISSAAPCRISSRA
jgi:hypothetical protein